MSLETAKERVAKARSLSMHERSKRADAFDDMMNDLDAALTELEQARTVINIAADWNTFDEWDDDTDGKAALVAWSQALSLFESQK